MLKKGDILIKGDIGVPGDGQGKDPSPVVQLVAMDGNIVIDSPSGANVHAALTAVNGNILVKTSRPQIFGALAMKSFDISSASQGADINYNQTLAALPGATDENLSEKNLLCGTMDPVPFLLR